MRKFINIIPSQNLILICPKGLSFEQMEYIHKNLNTQTQVYLDGELVRDAKGLSDTYDEDLNMLYPDYDKLVFIKNPYWRILHIYLWNFLYVSNPAVPKVETFKKTLISIYKNRDENIKINRIWHEMSPQPIEGYDKFFKVEDFVTEFKNWFGSEIKEVPEYFSQMKNVSSNYHQSMTSLSDFYDRESAEIVYQVHKPIFDKFGYSFHSYLDYHSPTQRIHQLHGDLSNKFES